ncbi:MAG: hypothetical protein JRE36_08515 [Deltaproteobacteria bacterium]|nr:hypothetical protein [Deltaproteobacteria bacterium]
MLLFSIFFVSFSTLAFEVLLTRVFAIGQWNHLSFMVISIALFGFGASGTFLSLVEASKSRRWQHPASQTSLCVLLCLFSIAVILSFLSLNRMPLDYFSLPVEPLQSLYLLAAYSFLSLPFFISGLIISIGYTTAPERAGLVYFASMTGSALGAIAPVLVLPFLTEGKLIIISSAAALIPAILSALKSLTKNENLPGHPFLNSMVLTCSAGIIIFGIISLISTVEIIRVTPSPYKALGQVLQFPETKIIETRTSVRGRIDRVKTPYVRFAPGLSLKYTRTLPGQHIIYRDGDSPLVLYDLKEKNDTDFTTFMLSYSGYFLTQHPERVLLIEQGGGSAVPTALASGAGQISIVQQNPYVAEMLRRQYELPVINRNPRAFLSQSTHRYDIIHVENWGASIPGAAALNQEYIFTIEAFVDYWKHLTATGTIIVSRKLLLPPSDSLRLWGTAYEALKRMAVNRPRDHLALLRNFDTFTLLISKKPVNDQSLIEFARHKNFDLVFLEGISRDMANKFHVFEKPYHFQKINQLAAAYESGRHNDFFSEYLLDVKPQSDRRPFPGRYLKWLKIQSLYKSMGSRFSLSQITYFLGIGAGFMFIELYLIKGLILLVGDPFISFTLVVSAILIFSSLGGLWVHTKSVRNIHPVLFTLIGVLILTAICLELLSVYLLRIPPVLRYFTALLLMLPAGFLMGMPFPLGMRYLLNSPVQRAYAWSVNGCASVLSAIVAAQAAISFGIPMIAGLAVLAYVVAFGAIKKR